MNNALNLLVRSLIRLTLGIRHMLTDPRHWSAISPYIDYNFLRYHGVDVEFGSARLIGFPIIRKARNSRISIGRGVTLVSHSRGNPAGISHPVILATLSEGATISIGNGCGLSGATLCCASAIDVGDFSGFGANATAYDTDFHPVKDFGTPSDSISTAASKPIRIGKYVWIGANAMILKGVAIEDRAVIGAGAVVRTNIPAGSVYLGHAPHPGARDRRPSSP